MAKVFTPEEVALHNKPDDMWVIIHGKVYDVSSLNILLELVAFINNNIHVSLNLVRFRHTF